MTANNFRQKKKKKYEDTKSFTVFIACLFNLIFFFLPRLNKMFNQTPVCIINLHFSPLFQICYDFWENSLTILFFLWHRSIVSCLILLVYLVICFISFTCITVCREIHFFKSTLLSQFCSSLCYAVSVFKHIEDKSSRISIIFIH